MGALDRLGYAELAQKLKPYIVPWVKAGAGGATGGPGVGIATHALNGPYHTGTLAQSQAPWALSQAAADARYLMATRQVIAGAGLTGGGVLTLDVQLDVGAGPGIAVAADTVALASTVAGSGLTFSTGVLAVGAGLGIAVNADDVALASSVAGAGLGYVAGVLSVGVANTGAAGLSVEADVVRLTSSSNPGAAAAVLASDASGMLELVKLRTGLIDTGSGDLVLSPASKGVKLVSGGLFQSNSFASGFAGNGFRLDDGVSQAGKASGELDNLTVRGLLRVYELLISKIRTGNGSYMFSDGGKVASVTGTGPYTLNFDEDHGLAANDLIRAQKFLGGAYTSSCTVTSVPTTKQAVVTLNTGNAPAAGYEYVRIGNTTDSSRRGSVYVTSNDSNAPYLDVVDGIASHADWGTAGKVRVRLGRLSGIAGGGGYGLFAGDNGAAWATVDAVSGFRAGYSGTTRFQVDTSGNLRMYDNTGTPVIALDNDGSSYFAGVMTIGTAGEIRQGTGTLGVDYTGLRIWRDTNVGRIGGYNNNVLQWYAGTNGYLYAGGGAAAVTRYGYMIQDTPDSPLFTWPFLWGGLHAVNDITAPGTGWKSSLMFGEPTLVYSGGQRWRSWLFQFAGDLLNPPVSGEGSAAAYALTIQDAAGHVWPVWHAGNDGAASGLDAGMLAGLGLSAAGNRWGVIPCVESDGVMEVGKYQDWHGSDTDASDNALRTYLTANNTFGVVNTSGRVEIGSRNTNYMHFITDLPAYYFDKTIAMYGYLSSYQTDLVLQRDGTTRIQGYTWGTYVTAHLTLEDVLGIVNVQASKPAAPVSGCKIYLRDQGGGDGVQLYMQRTNGTETKLS